MSSIRQKVVGFIRQFSTPSEPCNDDSDMRTNGFIQRYLKGHEIHENVPDILHGRTPQELPPKNIGHLSQTVVAAVTGPNGGLTTVNKLKKHFSVSDPDVHFIDIIDDETADERIIMKDINSNVSVAQREFLPLQKSESVPNTRQKIRHEYNRAISNSSSAEQSVDYDVAGISNWENPHPCAFGLSITLYELHPLTRIYAGEPIADCFSVVARNNSAILVLADGVNWGQKACIAARSAVHGCVDYLNKAIYTLGNSESFTMTTTDVFMALLRSFHCAHNLIIQEGGMFTTLTSVIVLPLSNSERYIACCCNVGDSLAYVYSPKYGVREITQGSHDVHAMRDMRDALGALGPVDGQNPELSNLTLAMTEVEPGDFIFLTSDGVSDNLDPVIGKFAGLPNVEAQQRHKLTLLRTEDLFRNGVSGKGSPIKTARDLVNTLLDFVTRLTSAKRRILEDTDLYVTKDGRNLNRGEQRVRRKEICGRLSMVPGKLDHATVTAYLVGELKS